MHNKKTFCLISLNTSKSSKQENVWENHFEYFSNVHKFHLALSHDDDFTAFSLAVTDQETF